VRTFIQCVALSIVALAVAQAAENRPLPKAWAGALDLRKALVIKGPEVAADSSGLLAAGVDLSSFAAPTRTKTTNPVFPDTARRARAEGLVQLQCLIEASGAVDACVTSQSVHPDLDRAAAEAIMRWKFDPATVQGVATAVVATFAMTFRLK
jgi:protein TonB